MNSGQAPMTVNFSGKVANLNADQLDGKSEADFYAAGSKVTDSSHADNATNANTLDGKRANQLTRAAYGEAQTNLTLSGTLQPYG